MHLHASVDHGRAPSSDPSPASPGAAFDEETMTRTRISPIGLLHVLRTAGPHLFGHAELYADLIQVEWLLERRRLFQMLLLGLLGFSCWLGLLLLLVASALLFSWPTPYAAAVVAALCGLLGLGVGFVGYRLRQLSRAGQHSFAGVRQELAADLSLLRPPR
ncbi:MAG TPA: phage holin family protein [Permianibacter sp.]|nr:phage holin family protein [Permianibacter sp.]